MANKTVTATVRGKFKMSYDEESEEFKAALERYNENIWKEGNSKDMLTYIAYNVAQYGAEEFIDGVGFVTINERERHIPEGEDWCGVDVDIEDIDDVLETEIN
jgi:hypothetical protein